MAVIVNAGKSPPMVQHPRRSFPHTKLPLARMVGIG